MDPGMSGKRVLVLASSKGLGEPALCCLDVRDRASRLLHVPKGNLEAIADDIRKMTGAKVTTVVADITTVEGRKATLAVCPSPDILVNNAGGLPPCDFRDWDWEDWIAAINANILSAIFMIKATVDGVIGRKF